MGKRIWALDYVGVPHAYSRRRTLFLPSNLGNTGFLSRGSLSLGPLCLIGLIRIIWYRFGHTKMFVFCR